MSNDKMKLFINSISLFPNEIDNKNPISKLIKSFIEVNSIIKTNYSFLTKLLYFNKKIINNILFSEDFIDFDSNLINHNLYTYFYLHLL